MVKKLYKIKHVITDIDGVWTDGGMYYDENGNEQKKFNTRDGMGVERLKEVGVETIIITSENTNIVKARANKLKIDKCYLGIKDKNTFFQDLCRKYKIDSMRTAFIGDDLNDSKLISNVYFSACPKDAFDSILEIVDYVCQKKGGHGAFREFAELIIKGRNEEN